MLDNIKKMVNDDNEVLDILPKNNVNNTKKYLHQVAITKEKYQGEQKKVLEYIISKNASLRRKYDIGYDDSLHPLILDMEKKISCFNPYHDAYEILGLDKLFYGLHKYYDNDLSMYNNNINKILDVFEKAGITLTKDNFYFSDSSEKYMEVLINERKNGNYNTPLIKDTFEQLFWKSHNMMRYILLNFNHLYYENEKKFNEYVKNEQKKILAEYDNSFDNLVSKYQELIINSNHNHLSNQGVLFNMFINKDISVNDYEKDKIEKLINEYLESLVVKNPKEIFMKLYSSVKEESFIYKYKYVLDEVDKLYLEKDSFKNLVNESKKEITAIEKNIYKKYKKIHSKSIFKKKGNDEVLADEIEQLLLELDGKYDVLYENRYKEKISTMVNPTIKDYLLLGKSYLFMANIAKEQEEDVDTILENITSNLYSPYNALIGNINIKDIETINLIIFDKFRLLGLKLTTDDFLVDNLESLTKVMGNIIIYYTLLELNVNLEEVNFIIQSDDIIKKA